MQHRHPQIGVQQALLGGVAGELLVLGADVQGRAAIVDGVGVDGDRELFDQRPVALVTLGEAIVQVRLEPRSIPIRSSEVPEERDA